MLKPYKTPLGVIWAAYLWMQEAFLNPRVWLVHLCMWVQACAHQGSQKEELRQQTHDSGSVEVGNVTLVLQQVQIFILQHLGFLPTENAAGYTYA